MKEGRQAKKKKSLSNRFHEYALGQTLFFFLRNGETLCLSFIRFDSFKRLVSKRVKSYNGSGTVGVARTRHTDWRPTDKHTRTDSSKVLDRSCFFYLRRRSYLLTTVVLTNLLTAIGCTALERRRARCVPVADPHGREIGRVEQRRLD